MMASIISFLLILFTSVEGLGLNEKGIVATSRSVVVFALMESMKEKNPPFASRALEQDPDYIRLDTRGRAYSRVLLMITERRSGQIDKILQSLRKTKPPKVRRADDALVDAALKVGVAQLMFSDIPPHAAVHETVEVLRMHGKIKVKEEKIRFVNAILRSAQRMGKEAAMTSTSVLDNIDPWLLREFTKAYGRDNATMIVEAAMTENPTFITVNQMAVPAHDEVGQQRRLERVRDIFATVSNPPKNDDESVDVDNESSSNVILPTGSILVDKRSGPVSNWPLYSDGDWWVQNPSATVPAIALWKGLLMRSKKSDNDGDEANNDEGLLDGLHVVDMCSAPGGKTAQLCAFGFGRVDAIEINEHRAKILRQNLKRLGMEGRCNVVVADGTQWKPGATTTDDDADRTLDAANYVDGIIVDAPCSATGNGSRHPVVLRKTINLPELVATQRGLLTHAVDDLLRPGGIMVYATCSLLQQEGEDQMRWLLSAARREERSGIDQDHNSATMETVPFVPGEIPGFDDAIDENGWLRILPGTLPGHLRFCDGFFIARMRKV